MELSGLVVVVGAWDAGEVLSMGGWYVSPIFPVGMAG